MAIGTNELLMIALSVSGVLAIGLVASIVLGAKAAARVADIEESVSKAESSLRRLTAELHLLTQAQQKLVKQIEEWSVTRESASPQAAPRGYEQAIRMARTGAPAMQLVNSCGMTRSEADLLVALHGPQVAA